MNRVTIRDFKGLNQDFDQTDMNVLNATLLSDVCNTPKNALKTPNGSTKWNAQSLGFVNGLKDYKGRNGGRFIVDVVSQTGHGFGGSPGSPYYPAPTVTWDDTTINSEDDSGPAIREFTSVDVHIPAATNNGENFTITVYAKDQFGAIYPLSGTVVLTENGLGSLSASTLSMSGGIASSSTLKYYHEKTTENVTITATISGKSGNDTMTTTGYHIEFTVTGTLYYGWTCSGQTIDVTVKRADGSVATDYTSFMGARLMKFYYSPSTATTYSSMSMANGIGSYDTTSSPYQWNNSGYGDVSVTLTVQDTSGYMAAVTGSTMTGYYIYGTFVAPPTSVTIGVNYSASVTLLTSLGAYTLYSGSLTVANVTGLITMSWGGTSPTWINGIASTTTLTFGVSAAPPRTGTFTFTQHDINGNAVSQSETVSA